MALIYLSIAIASTEGLVGDVSMLEAGH